MIFDSLIVPLKMKWKKCKACGGCNWKTKYWLSGDASHSICRDCGQEFIHSIMHQFDGELEKVEMWEDDFEELL
jgi:hypothetical protein